MTPDELAEQDEIAKNLLSQRIAARVSQALALDDRFPKGPRANQTGVNALAKAARIDAGNMSRIISGERGSMSLYNAKKLCETLGIRLEWLVYGDGPMKDPIPRKLFIESGAEPAAERPARKAK